MKHGVDSRISKGVRLRGRAVKCASGLVPAQLREQRSRDGNDKDFFEGGHHPRTEAPSLKWKSSVTSLDMKLGRKTGPTDTDQNPQILDEQTTGSECLVFVATLQ